MDKSKEISRLTELLKSKKVREAAILAESISKDLQGYTQACPECGNETTVLIKNNQEIGECGKCNTVFGKISNKMEKNVMKIFTKEEVGVYLKECVENRDPEIIPGDVKLWKNFTALRPSVAHKLNREIGLFIPGQTGIPAVEGEEPLNKAKSKTKSAVNPDKGATKGEYYGDSTNADTREEVAKGVLQSAGTKMAKEEKPQDVQIRIARLATKKMKKSEEELFEDLRNSIYKYERGQLNDEEVEGLFDTLNKGGLISFMPESYQNKFKELLSKKTAEESKKEEDLVNKSSDLSKDEVLCIMGQMMVDGEEPQYINRHSITKYEQTNEISDHVMKLVLRKSNTKKEDALSKSTSILKNKAECLTDTILKAREDSFVDAIKGTLMKAGVSGEASDYISRKISKLVDEGYPQDQAVAVAYSYARKKGFDVPGGKSKE